MDRHDHYIVSNVVRRIARRWGKHVRPGGAG